MIWPSILNNLGWSKSRLCTICTSKPFNSRTVHLQPWLIVEMKWNAVFFLFVCLFCFFFQNLCNWWLANMGKAEYAQWGEGRKYPKLDSNSTHTIWSRTSWQPTCQFKATINLLWEVAYEVYRVMLWRRLDNVLYGIEISKYIDQWSCLLIPFSRFQTHLLFPVHITIFRFIS